MAQDLYGTDILMTEEGDFAATPGGDLATVTGLDNLDQAVTNRLLTTPDEYLFGTYGCTLRQYVDSVDPNITKEIPQDISASLLEDSRISSSSSTAVQNSDGSISVEVTVASAFGDSTTVGVTT